MSARRRIARRLPWLLALLAMSCGLALATGAQAIEYSYPDKLFGGDYTFSPSADEIIVRLATVPGGIGTSEVAAIAADGGLDVVRDAGVADNRVAVLRTRSGGSTVAARATLAADPRVTRAYPALRNADGTTRYFVPDQVVVQFRGGMREAAMLADIARLGSQVVIDHWTPGFYTVSVPEGVDVFDQVRAFIALPDVVFAELSTISYDDGAFVPNDPLYATQWACNNTGGGGMVADADADVQQAWDLERGDPNVIVAVIDSGVDWDHPDLQPNILQNLGEDADGDGQTMVWNGSNWVMDPGDINGIDDDANGRIDDVFGWDFSANDNDPNPNTAEDQHGHGTCCAGLVAAVGNNAQGVSGVAPNCRLLPLRINLFSGMNQNRADAINYAVAQAPNYGAMIITCSWIASSGSTISIQNAVNAARAADVLPLFAAGNSNNAVRFPASLASAMAIAATSPCDERKSPTSCDGENWWGSCFGAALSVGAPGVQMQTTDVIGGGWSPGAYLSNFNGTSSATPFAAGIAALLQSKALELFGSPLSANDLQALIEDSAEQVGGYAYPGGVSNELGHGRVNAFDALNRLIIGPAVEILPPPVDIALSIDRSYSMVGTPILAAENAAAQVVRLMDVGDRIAVTSYSGGTNPGGLPGWPAWTDYATTTIMSNIDKDAAIAAINTGGHVYDLTAIGAGLTQARNELFGASPANYPQSIILLSDGNNTDGPDPLTLLPLPAPQPHVYTIGFGPFADAATLSGLASGTGGQYYFAGGTGAKTMGGELPIIQTYQMSLMQATERENLGWERGQIRDQGEERHFFQVDSSCDQILIGLLWGPYDPEAFKLYLQDPSGVTYDSNSPEWIGDITLSAFRINRPEPGQWLAQVVRVGNGQGSGYYDLNLAASSRVQSQLTLIPRGWSLPLTIQLRLFQLSQDEGVVPLRNCQVPCAVTYPNGEYSQLQLNDAGQDGDEMADDGVYTATLLNTGDSGNYTVEATAYGQTLGGDPFTRYDMASTVLLRDAVPTTPTVDLPDVVALHGTELELPIVISPLVDSFGIQTLELGVTYDPAVLQLGGLGDLSGTLLENWATQVADQGSGLLLTGSGPALRGSGILARVKFQVVGELGDATPLTFNLINLKDGQGNQVPTNGQNGSAVVQSSLEDRVPTPFGLTNGWGLRSLPVVLSDGETLADQLPAVQAVLGWTPNGYDQTPSPEAGQGFWLSYGGPDSDGIVTGTPLGIYTRELPAGWSLVGGLFDRSATPVVEPTTANAEVFRYAPNQGYLPAVQLDPGQGYWIHVDEAASLTAMPGQNKQADRHDADKVLTQAEFTANGDAMSGVPSINSVVIGDGASGDTQVPYPPAPPAYTTLLRLLAGGDAGFPLYSDLRVDASGQMWFFELQAGGNQNGSGSTVRWYPDQLRAILDQPWVLHEGVGIGGPVVVADMRETSELTVNDGGTHLYTMVVGAVSAVDGESLPTSYALAGNFPNPFNPQTTIRYDVPRTGHVQLDVYDLRGQRVARLVDGTVEAGRRSVIWNGRDDHDATVPSGVYFARLSAGGVQQTGRMVLLK